MAKNVKTIADYTGTDAVILNVECHITNGLPSVVIIGYASKAVDEAKERLRASFANCNIPFPKKRVTLNLSPADIPKDSTSIDLAMAASILAQTDQISNQGLGKIIFLGELSLDGTLNPVRGLVGRLLAAKSKGYKTFYIPQQNLEQALLIPNIIVKPASSLKQVFLDLSGTLELKATATGSGKLPKRIAPTDIVDFSEVAGQPIAKRALEIAAAGHHNVLLHGPPGTGKTMLAKAMCGILPSLNHDEVLEVTQIHSLASGNFSEIILSRPFRAPHHTASTVALVGGGSTPKPGEASLAHRGVLFLDEIPEFSHTCLEALRQPLEDGYVTIARIKDSATYPADFILVATQNPCPCGYWGTSKPCRCTAAAIAKYQKKVSGPILDRIDLHLSVHDVDHSKLIAGSGHKHQSQDIKQRVATAYELQHRRFQKTRFNSSMTNKEIREQALLNNSAKELLDNAAAKLEISGRAYIRAVRVARTIADLAGSEAIELPHISEALQYRQQIYA